MEFPLGVEPTQNDLSRTEVCGCCWSQLVGKGRASRLYFPAGGELGKSFEIQQEQCLHSSRRAEFLMKGFNQDSPKPAHVRTKSVEEMWRCSEGPACGNALTIHTNLSLMGAHQIWARLRGRKCPCTLFSYDQNYFLCVTISEWIFRTLNWVTEMRVTFVYPNVSFRALVLHFFPTISHSLHFHLSWPNSTWNHVAASERAPFSGEVVLSLKNLKQKKVKR